MKSIIIAVLGALAPVVAMAQVGLPGEVNMYCQTRDVMQKHLNSVKSADDFEAVGEAIKADPKCAWHSPPVAATITQVIGEDAKRINIDKDLDVLLRLIQLDNGQWSILISAVQKN